jgi:hypothetical protein
MGDGFEENPKPIVLCDLAMSNSSLPAECIYVVPASVV